MDFDKYGGRRYLLCWGVLMSANVLQWFGKIDLSGVAWGLAITGTVAAYITNNTWQKKNEGTTP